MDSGRERVVKAFNAMRCLGIPDETTRPALKKLFKLYDKNWELIEEDNYRTLADAIFQYDDDKLMAEKQLDKTNEDNEPPFKKPHGIDRDKVLPTLANGKNLLEDERELPRKSKVISKHSDEGRNQIGSSSAITIPPTMSTYDIASSACGQVKISLTCKLTLSQLNFHFPNAQETLSLARQFCNTEGSDFSLINLLSEFCETYLETISDPDKRSHLNNTFPRNHARPSLEGKKASSSKKRALKKISDITNGTEKVKISLLDETGGEDWPHFVYCPENIIYESAYVHISLARISEDDCCLDCRGDCLSSQISCPCARETGGEFAYTQEGLLSEKFLSTCISIKLSEENQTPFYCQDCPLERAKNGNTQGECKGHRVRKFIKECWRKCGCKMDCGNRVVQRGISRKLQVFLTSGGKGWGLRPLEEIPKGAFICEYVGEILTNMELYERNTKSNSDGKHAYPVLLDADWATEGVLKDEEALCLDATHFGNVARFINHRCFDGNLIEVPVQVETPDRHYYHLAFFTKRKVEALEELTWDYEIDFEDNSHPVDAFRCLCGSEHCRDKRRGQE